MDADQRYVSYEIVGGENNNVLRPIISLHSIGDRPFPRIDGLNEAIHEENQHPVSCHVNYFRADSVHFTWFLQSLELPSHSWEISKHNNTPSYYSALNYNFTRDDDGKAVMCSFSARNDLSEYEESTTGVVNIFCKCRSYNSAGTIYDHSLIIIINICNQMCHVF